VAPRYFNSKSTATKAQNIDPQVVVHLLDVFILETPNNPPEEWLVALSHDGSIVVINANDRHLLPQKALEELSFYEVSGNSPRRLVFSELSIFLVQLLEQPPNTPGVNDPIYLYGTLYSPLPLQGQYSGTEGQLTITRADLLEGLTLCAPWAFRYPNTGGSGGCCFSMLLPADRHEELSQGRGAVLAYALLDPALAFEDAANDAMINQLLFDTLSAMKEDMKTEGNPPDMLPMLPVPSRISHEQKLINEGFTIEGNVATQKGKGFLSTLFGKNKIVLPTQGDTTKYLQLAQEVLKSLPGWPEPKTQQLRRRHTANTQQSIPAQQPRVPQAYTPPPPPPPTRPRPSDWMNDFIEEHHQPNTPPPRLTPAIQKRASATLNEEKKTSAKDWSNDFDTESGPPTQKKIQAVSKPVSQPAKPATKAKQDPQTMGSHALSNTTPAQKSSSSNKPDWMKDFE
jgi:hypothetical protein